MDSNAAILPILFHYSHIACQEGAFHSVFNS